jgi:hypothetical protein
LKQAKQLLSKIILGFQFKLLLNQDVEYDYEKYKILSIQGVSVSKKKWSVVGFRDTFFKEKTPVFKNEKVRLI